MQKERIEQLKKQREALKMNLNELNYLIEGYEKALEAQEKKNKKDDKARN
tara:strand:+ start:4628 stop:4777 length:150 start_codon:yes stop_codon:yes gene_type:complete